MKYQAISRCDGAFQEKIRLKRTREEVAEINRSFEEASLALIFMDPKLLQNLCQD